MPPNANELECQTRMRSLLEEISPLPRLINSPGMDRTFEIVKREFPHMAVHEFPAGSEAEDWIVPESWQATKGLIRDRDGAMIASLDDHHLFVAPFSQAVHGRFSKDEIARHVTTRPDRPDAFPFEHRHAYDYQLKDWGIAMPHHLWTQLADDEYEVIVEVERGRGSMKVGEYLLKGRRPETLCICAHIDELCNDDLSGCVVALELARHLESLPDRQYTYQILLVPEVVGTLFFAHNNPKTVANTIGMLFLEGVGAGAEWLVKKAHVPGSKVEDLIFTAMEMAKLPHSQVDFFGGYGNDERVYAWPGIDIPGVALQRFPFEEYHTSDDSPGIINDQHLLDAVRVGKSLIEILETDYVPSYTRRLQPWLTRWDLYFDRTRDPENHHKFNNQLLYSIDGVRSVLDLSKLAGLEFGAVRSYIDDFVEAGIATKGGLTQVDKQ